jgi:hypothetical protein
MDDYLASLTFDEKQWVLLVATANQIGKAQSLWFPPREQETNDKAMDINAIRDQQLCLAIQLIAGCGELEARNAISAVREAATEEFQEKVNKLVRLEMLYQDGLSEPSQDS